MRIIGHLDGAAKARTFCDYLYAQGIDNQAETDKNGSYAIWIHSEEELERSKKLLARFQENPADPKYAAATQTAEQMREKKKQEQSTYEKRVKERRNLFRPLAQYGFGPVTFVFIFISVVVFIMQNVKGLHAGSWDIFFISRVDILDSDRMSVWKGFLTRIQNFNLLLPEIRHGQLWRFITPIFLHFGFLHIFFNMMWLRDLGSMVEGRQNGLLLFIFIVTVAAVSNLGQYLVAGGAFGGMSGVVYGLMGYIWIRGKLDPASGLYLHPSTVTMMIIWFFVCVIGVMGIANTAHGVGLLMGISWGFLSSLRHR